MRCNDMHFIAFFQNKLSIRDIDFLTSFYCTYQNFNLEFPIYFCKRKSCKCTVFSYNEFYQFHTSLHERLYFTRLREKQYSGYLICRRTFRINRHTQMQVFLQKIHLSVVNWVAYSGYRMFCSQPFCQKTTQHIHLVR